mgnify:FL=1
MYLVFFLYLFFRYSPYAIPTISPPKWAVFPIGMFPASEISHRITSIPGPAYFIFMGMGINITYTGRFGVSKTSKPTNPNNAPEAPTAKVLMSAEKNGMGIKLRSTKNKPANKPEII